MMGALVTLEARRGRSFCLRGFLIGVGLINLAGVAAVWVIATKYLGTSGSAALWGMGAVIGYLMASIQALHLFAPTQSSDGFLARTGTMVMGLTLFGWLLGVVLSMGAEDGASLVADARTLAAHVWQGLQKLLT